MTEKSTKAKPKQKDLTILPVRMDEVHDERWDDLDERLPKPPFIIVINAPVASGKTTSIVNMLYNDNYYRDKFDSVVIFSTSIENDLTWKVAIEDDKNTIITGDKLKGIDDIVETIFKIQKEKVTAAERDKTVIPHLLMIFDDCLGMLGNKFGNACSRHRHPRISMMVASQDFRSIPLLTRQNASHYMIYRTHNDKEVGKMAEEFGGQYGTKRFLELYQQATAERYSFLTLHKRTVKAYKRFEELLYDRAEEAHQDQDPKEITK